MKADFYRAFEERHRGSRELIKERLRAYLPFLRPLAQQYPGKPALDLGCGRGEWLELLGEAGLQPHGIDIDDAMLESAREAGLSVERADALAFLRQVPDASQSLVSAFHLVEHLEFEQVQEMVGEAMRVLLPGGLLVMETPNPENLVVGASSFYLDPTHLRPLPPELLAFLPEFQGFARTKIVRLQEPPAVRGTAAPSLYDVLGSASPDYSVVAQKAASPQASASDAAFDAAFDTPFGVTTADLASRYQRGSEERAAATEAAVALVNQRLAEVAGRVEIVEDHANRLATEVRSLSERSAAQVAPPAESVAARIEIVEDHANRLAAEMRSIPERSAAQLAAHAESVAARIEIVEDHANRLATEVRSIPERSAAQMAAQLAAHAESVAARIEIVEDHANRLAVEVRSLREQSLAAVEAERIAAQEPLQQLAAQLKAAMERSVADAGLLAELSQQLQFEREQNQAVVARASAMEEKAAALQQQAQASARSAAEQVAALRRQVSDTVDEVELAQARHEQLRREWAAFQEQQSLPWLARRRNRANGPRRGFMHALVESHPVARQQAVNLARRLGLHEPMRRAYWWLTGKGAHQENLQAQAMLPGGAVPPQAVPPLTPRAQEILQRFEAALRKKKRSS